MDFAFEIKRIRQSCLLSQKEFAKELGVAFATINRWEQGRTTPALESMKHIIDFCKVKKIDSKELEKYWLELKMREE